LNAAQADGKLTLSRTVLACLIAAILLLASVAVMQELQISSLESKQQSESLVAPYHSISLQGGEPDLCAAGCNYPAPYLLATIQVNTTSPLRGIDLYVNGTFDIHYVYVNNFTGAMAYIWKSGSPNVQIIMGESYDLLFLATFEDGYICGASITVTASG
jgi:hypothetical protein